MLVSLKIGVRLQDRSSSNLSLAASLPSKCGRISTQKSAAFTQRSVIRRINFPSQKTMDIGAGGLASSSPQLG